MAVRQLRAILGLRPQSSLRYLPCVSYQTSRSRMPRLNYITLRTLAIEASKPKLRTQNTINDIASDTSPSKASPTVAASDSSLSTPVGASTNTSSKQDPLQHWEDNPDWNISNYSELPHSNFGVNQHMVINDEFKDALKRILWGFKAPIRYAFAYGSGVFPQSKPTPFSPMTAAVHAKAPPAVQKAQGGTPKMIDFIFGVSFTEHWHSLNLRQHRDHYSALGFGPFGTWQVSQVQDNWGAGVYFNPYVTVNGILIKYGVVNLDTLCKDLSEWNTLYVAGRLHKPVKILRDDPRVRFANQLNLIAALRTALLLLPPNFTEQELYGTIASLSYMGDPRMSLPTEDPGKIANIVGNSVPNFRRLYGPLIEDLANVEFNDPTCSEGDWMTDPDANVRLVQDMDPVKRGNMVRRLPKTLRAKLYFEFQKKYQIPQLEFNEMIESSTNQGGGFEQRIARASEEDLRSELRGVIKRTVWWPSVMQSAKGLTTGGISRSLRYLSEKRQKHRDGLKKAKAAAAVEKEVVAGRSEDDVVGKVVEDNNVEETAATKHKQQEPKSE